MLLLCLSWLAVADMPKRVVSINLCTDQLLMMLAEPSQIASISHLARDPDSSFLHQEALAHPINHARLEELIRLQPDLVLAGEYSDPRLLIWLKGFGMRVEQFPLSHSIEDIERDVSRMARLLHRTAQGDALIEAMRSRLRHHQDVSPPTNRPKALFYQPRGYTSGSDTLQDEALRIAGWRNLSAELGIEGYAPIDLETLLLAQPERIFTSSHTAGARSLAQQQLQHPALGRLHTQPSREIPFKYWICAGPMITDAIDALSAAHHD